MTDTSQIQVFETSLLIKVEVSPEEKDRSARALADATELHERLVTERKATNSDYTERIHQQRGIMSAEAKIVKHGLRMEETAVNVEFNREANTIRYTYVDGGELVNGENWRPITEKERGLADAMRQEQLPGTDGDEGDPEAVVAGLETEE